MLKLQQETTAMRVVISMENNIDFDTSKMHTIKRYMSELKDEDSVSNGGLRCRELDCLRAYYFVAILSYLRSNLGKKEEESDDISLESESKRLENLSLGTEKGSEVSEIEQNIVQVEPQTQTDQNGNKKSLESASVEDQEEVKSRETIDLYSPVSEGSVVNPTNVQNENKTMTSPSTCSSGAENSEKTESQANAQQSENLKGEMPLQTKSDQKSPSGKDVRPKVFAFMTFQAPDYCLSVSKLSHIARGLLWDIQGKRYALTETLGYIYKGISQLLLDLKPSSISPSPSQLEVNQQNTAENLPSDINRQLSSESSYEAMSSRSSVSSLPGIHPPVLSKKRHFSEPALQHGDRLDLVQRSISSSGQASLEAMSAHHGSIEKDIVEESDLYMMSSDWLIKSRKILWEDEPHHPLAAMHPGKGNLTSIINPNKYINVPDEWYNMPADQKYTMKYVTMEILKEEQEYMMQELKNGPDAIQVSIAASWIDLLL